MDSYKRVISPLTGSVVGTNGGVYGSIDRGAEPLPVLQKISESENDYDLHGGMTHIVRNARVSR